MPSTSAKQHRFMAAIAHSPSFAKKVGVSQSVGKDFTAADKGKTFNKGGMMKTRKFANEGYVDDSDMDDEGNTRSKYEIDPDSRRAHGLYDKAPAAKAPAAKTSAAKPVATRNPSPSPSSSSPSSAKTSVSPATTKNTGVSTGLGGNFTPEERAANRESVAQGVKKAASSFGNYFKDLVTKTRAERYKEANPDKNFAKGGMTKESKAMVGKEVAFFKKKGAPASMIKHEKAEMMGMKKGGMSSYAKGGGIESRGKTKGTIIRMASGGSVSSASRRADGIAQRGKTKC